MVEQTEERVRARIAEGERAAENRVRAGEEEAAEIVAEARAQAERAVGDATSEALAIVGRAQENAAKMLEEANAEATRQREDAQEKSRELLRTSRVAADEARTEGLEVVANLREMGSSLRANAERLLRDVQRIHSDLIGRLERMDGELGGEGRPRRAPADDRTRPAPAADGEVLDVPEFIPPG
jgi:cell division septum initiation protein DivIVA